jgi:hypothetical protein
MPLPKSIIKKYGVSKKAWAVYKGRKKRKRSTIKSKRSKSRTKMARRRRKSYRRRKTGMTGLMGTAVGVGGYILYESVIKPRIPLASTTKNLVELGAGVMLARRGGVIGKVAKTAVVINTYQLLSGFIGGGLGGMVSTAPAQQVYS